MHVYGARLRCTSGCMNEENRKMSTLGLVYNLGEHQFIRADEFWPVGGLSK